MPLSAIGHYMDLLPKRQAEMRMMQGEAASVPYMDEAKHGEWVQSVNRYFETELKAEVVTPRKLMGLGIGARFVTASDQTSTNSTRPKEHFGDGEREE